PADRQLFGTHSGQPVGHVAGGGPGAPYPARTTSKLRSAIFDNDAGPIPRALQRSEEPSTKRFSTFSSTGPPLVSPPTAAYVWRARAITWAAGDSPEMSTPALSRTSVPSGIEP